MYKTYYMKTFCYKNLGKIFNYDKMGGLGIRSAVQLAPSAFLASAAATSDLVHLIVPPYLQSLSIPNVDEAKDLWSLGHGQSPPEVISQHQQRA